MNTATLNIKTDPSTKEQIKAFADNIGLPVSALVNAQIKQILRTGRVELNTDLEPTDFLVDTMRQARADYAADRDITHTNSTDEAMAHLDSLTK
jgi:antitoxin component of RelBE/YafQ-DinJ toxin-antitoxin module